MRKNLAKNLFHPAIQKLTRKRSITVKVTDGWVVLRGTYWDGGSRSEYSQACPKTGGSIIAGEANYKPGKAYPSSEPASMRVSPGRMIKEGGTFCGKPAGLTLHVHPTDLWLLFDGDVPPELKTTVQPDSVSL